MTSERDRSYWGKWWKVEESLSRLLCPRVFHMNQVLLKAIVVTLASVLTRAVLVCICICTAKLVCGTDILI